MSSENSVKKRKVSHTEMKLRIVFFVFSLLFAGGLTAAYIVLHGRKIEYYIMFETIALCIVFSILLFYAVLTPMRDRLQKRCCSERVTARIKSFETIYTYESDPETRTSRTEYRTFLPRQGIHHAGCFFGRSEAFDRRNARASDKPEAPGRNL